MTYTLENRQLVLHGNTCRMGWNPMESFEDKELAEKEKLKLESRFPNAHFRLTHSPD